MRYGYTMTIMIKKWKQNLLTKKLKGAHLTKQAFHVHSLQCSISSKRTFDMKLFKSAYII